MNKADWQERRCELGFHNFTNFMDSSIHIEYNMDIPNEVLMCKRCGHMLTPNELRNRQHYQDEDILTKKDREIIDTFRKIHFGHTKDGN